MIAHLAKDKRQQKEQKELTNLKRAVGRQYRGFPHKLVV